MVQDKRIKSEWEAVYDNSFVRLEKALPFEEAMKDPAYRFKWVLKKTVGCKGKFLDVGCSYGVLVKLASELGFEVYGTDVSQKVIDNIKDNVPCGTFVRCEANSPLPYADEQFDVVACQELLEHVVEPAALVGELVRITKKGGKILLTTPVLKNYDCPEHLNHFSFYNLTDIFDKYDKQITYKICRINKFKKEGKSKLFAIEVNRNE